MEYQETGDELSVKYPDVDLDPWLELVAVPLPSNPSRYKDPGQLKRRRLGGKRRTAGAEAAFSHPMCLEKCIPSS